MLFLKPLHKHVVLKAIPGREGADSRLSPKIYDGRFKVAIKLNTFSLGMLIRERYMEPLHILVGNEQFVGLIVLWVYGS